MNYLAINLAFSRSIIPYGRNFIKNTHLHLTTVLHRGNLVESKVPLDVRALISFFIATLQLGWAQVSSTDLGKVILDKAIKKVEKVDEILSKITSWEWGLGGFSKSNENIKIK